MALSFGGLRRIFRSAPKAPKPKPKLIALPARLTAFASLDFAIELNATPLSEAYSFDFSALTHIEPFAMLTTTHAINSLVKRSPTAEFEAVNYEHCSYAAHMGFFQACTIPFGNLPGQARGSSRYIPITFLSVGTLKQEAATSGKPLGEIVETHAQTQAKVLLQSDQGELFKTVSYCLREIMRNVVEHSGSTFIGMCGQFWPSKNLAEVAILDEGVGIFQTLSRNKKLQLLNDNDALKHSILPGITGNVTQAADPMNVWANSGYGLYMTSRICQEGGDFLLSSGKSALRLRPDRRAHLNSEVFGTAVRLQINTDQKVKTQQLLSKFSKEGSELAKNIGKSAVVDPSSASVMLDTFLRARR